MTRITVPLGAMAIAFAMAGTAGLVLASGIASAAPAPTPHVVEGNVTTCAEAGLTGTILFSDEMSGPAGSGTVRPDNKTLDITVNAGFTVSGVAVKGGPDTNVYDGPFTGPTTVEGMVSPLNPGGQLPTISHWLVCGGPSPTPPPTTPPSQTPTATPTATPTSQTPTATPSKTPTRSPTAAPPTTPPGGGLPTTGTRTALIMGSGAALFVSGAMLLLALRHRRRFDG
ncbi:MAG TPA: hypothetical protein VGJ63_00440 [Micromonosporaceae bacterium]|jgi:hypothetical protein